MKRCDNSFNDDDKLEKLPVNREILNLIRTFVGTETTTSGTAMDSDDLSIKIACVPFNMKDDQF